jgi:hypothetical protein
LEPSSHSRDQNVALAVHGFRCLPWDRVVMLRSWAFGGCGLSTSAEASARTPQLHQTRLLRAPSSHPRGRSRSAWDGCLFLGAASSLDAFSPYPSRRSCPAMPCRTTGRPEAAASRSSRTQDPFPSDSLHPQQIKSDLSHDGLNPAHVPF